MAGSALVAAWALVFVMNAVTFPLPPAWMVLAAVYSTTAVPLLPLTIGGSAAAALGRGLYSRLVSAFTNRLPASSQANAQAIATAAHSRLRWPWLFVAVYSFLPVSSDAVFIAVGMGALPATSSLIAFFLARSIYNTLMVIATGPIVGNVADMFAGHFTWGALVIVFVSIAAYVLFLRLPWTRWLGTHPSSSIT